MTSSTVCILSISSPPQPVPPLLQRRWTLPLWRSTSCFDTSNFHIHILRIVSTGTTTSYAPASLVARSESSQTRATSSSTRLMISEANA